MFVAGKSSVSYNGNTELFISLLISISPTGEKGGQGEIVARAWFAG